MEAGVRVSRCRFHIVALNLKGGGWGKDCLVGLSRRTVVVFEGVLLQFCILLIFSFHVRLVFFTGQRSLFYQYRKYPKHA